MGAARLGRYRLLQNLGEGSTGVVYRAAAVRRTGVYAIKRIRPSLLEERRFVDSLLTEAHICAPLHHPGIVRLYECGQAGREYFLAMEYVDGISLKELLARLSSLGQPMPAGVACYIAREVARALGYAHRRCDPWGRPLRIVHRDVNPSNIMVTRAGRVKLLDFGIATAASHTWGEATGSAYIKGTIGYLSPEQAQGLPLDGRSDLFSLGLVLYQCLTGRRAFDSPNPLHALLSSNGDVIAPSLVRPDLDRALDPILSRLLARDPDDRPPTGEVAAAALDRLMRRLGGGATSLHQLLVGLPEGGSATGGSAGPSPVTRRLALPPRRRSWAGLAALAAAVGLLVPALWLGAKRRPGSDRLLTDAALAAGWNYRDQQRCDEAIALAWSMRERDSRAGNWQRVIAAGQLIGACLSDRGDDQGALRMAEENLAISERSGDRKPAPLLLRNSAYSLLRLGRRAEARARYQRALAMAGEIGDQKAACRCLLDMARERSQEGDLPEAIAFIGRALDQARIHCQDDLPQMLEEGVSYQAERGALAQLRRLSDEAEALSRQGGGVRARYCALHARITELRITDQLAQARQPLQEAQALVQTVGWTNHVAMTDIAGGAIALDRGNLALAETLARQALGSSRLDEERGAEVKLEARALLAGVLLARGRVDSAGAELDQALALAPASLPVWSRGRLDITRARIEAAQGRVQAARERLEQLLALCEKRGLVALGLEARLAALELGPRSRRAAQALGRAAAQRGFTLIARRAAALIAAAPGARALLPQRRLQQARPGSFKLLTQSATLPSWQKSVSM